MTRMRQKRQKRALMITIQKLITRKNKKMIKNKSCENYNKKLKMN